MGYEFCVQTTVCALFVLAFKITVDRRMYIIYLNIKLSDYIKVSWLKGVSLKCSNVSEDEAD